MRLRILSDLHCEFADFVPAVVPADVVVLAGDIAKGPAVVPWVRRHFPETPCVVVPGNHEYYGGTMQEVLRDLRSAAAGTNVHVLDRDALEVDGVRFLGATLWTDFAFGGDRVKNLSAAAFGMADYRYIRFEPTYRHLRPEDTWDLHALAVKWLTESLAAPARRTVVVTHHAPSVRSIAEHYLGNPLNSAFASELDALVESSGAELWVHGHTHHAVDYRIGATRVLSNQRGYPTERDIGFRPELVVDL
ncbi:MAG: metallophosphoesterase family protein [Phycisphaerae bacterium]|nr:metallophosphoesterase family protein [Phycisphaerae bacterium]